jgi:hypothetical protein
MKARDILKTFGFDLQRYRDCFGQRFVATPRDNPYTRYSATTTSALIEMIIPEPPGLLTAGAIRTWAEECLAAYRGKDNPDIEALAKAAFAAYDIVPADEFIECFVGACKVDRRRLMERLG